MNKPSLALKHFEKISKKTTNSELYYELALTHLNMGND